MSIVMSRIKFISVLIIFMSISGQAFSLQDTGDKKKIAVAVFPENGVEDKFGRVLRGQLEAILLDNDITVLDLDKSRELQNNWDKLDDPSSFITAEDFFERTEQYQLDSVISLYYSYDVVEFISGFYTATAIVTAREVNSKADVKTKSSIPMGAIGNTPSDGLTANSAIANALRREVDGVAERLGLEILLPQTPLFLDLELIEQSKLPVKASVLDSIPLTDSLKKEIKSIYSSRQGGQRTTISCLSGSDDGSLVAVGLYLADLDLQRGRRSYGASLALYDIASAKTANKIVVHDLMEGRSKNGSADIKACRFLNGWRFVLLGSSRGIELIDVEKGRSVETVDFNKPPKKLALSIYTDEGEKYIKVDADDKSNIYLLEAKK